MTVTQKHKTKRGTEKLDRNTQQKAGPKRGPKAGPKTGPKEGPKAGPKAGPENSSRELRLVIFRSQDSVPTFSFFGPTIFVFFGPPIFAFFGPPMFSFFGPLMVLFFGPHRCLLNPAICVCARSTKRSGLGPTSFALLVCVI